MIHHRLHQPPQHRTTMQIKTYIEQYTRQQIQQAVISFILINLGDDIVRVGKGTRTRLNALCKLARSRYLPQGANERTCRRWFEHYLAYGETPAETGNLLTKYSGAERVLWTARETTMLKSIVDLDPGLYLDEIVKRLEDILGKKWNASLVWEKIRTKLEYSLQVVTDKALQQDENERSRYKAALSAVLVRPEMVVFIDESHKDKNAARRRRWWSRRGLTPVRRSTFSGNRATRYRSKVTTNDNRKCEEPT